MNINNQYYSKQTELSIINGQIIALFLFILTIFISIILAYNEKLNIENKTPLFNDKDALIIAIVNRIIVIVLSLYFVYTTIKKKELTNSDNIPILTSIIALLASLIGLYDLLRNYINLKNNKQIFNNNSDFSII